MRLRLKGRGTLLVLVAGLLSCFGVAFQSHASGEKQASEPEVRVAVASNFLGLARELAQLYESQYQIAVRIQSGSSAKLTTQILLGAPVDVFLSADAAMPDYLYEDGKALETTVYANGRLILWSKQAGGALRILEGESIGDDAMIVIANPRTAPYGRAAEQVLESLGRLAYLLDHPNKLIRAENVAQALQIAMSGSVDLAILPLSFVPRLSAENTATLKPAHYQPIVQKAALLSDSSISRSFIDFLLSDQVQTLIANNGYYRANHFSDKKAVPDR